MQVGERSTAAVRGEGDEMLVPHSARILRHMKEEKGMGVKENRKMRMVVLTSEVQEREGCAASLLDQGVQPVSIETRDDWLRGGMDKVRTKRQGRREQKCPTAERKMLEERAASLVGKSAQAVVRQVMHVCTERQMVGKQIMDPAKSATHIQGKGGSGICHRHCR